MTMHRTPGLYEEDAERVIFAIGILISKGTLQTRYTMEGVQVNLPFINAGECRIAFQDFERIIKIFTEEPFGSAFDAIRKLAVNLAEDAPYKELVKNAVKYYFPFKKPTAIEE